MGSLDEDGKAYGREVGGQRCRWVPELVLGSNLEIQRNTKKLKDAEIRGNLFPMSWADGHRSNDPLTYQKN